MYVHSHRRLALPRPARLFFPLLATTADDRRLTPLLPLQLLLCTGPNRTGACKHQVYRLATCVQLEAPYLRNTSTFEPDAAAFSCFPRVTDCGAVCRSPTGCTFGAVNSTYKHKLDLGAIRWNTLIASFDCLADRPARSPS